MPWDATRLRVAAFEPDGTLGEAMLAAGGPDESIAQPEWSPDGHAPPRLRPERLVEPLPPGRRPAARAARRDGGGVRRPGLDSSTDRRYGFLPDGAIVAVARAGGRDHLFRIEPGARIGELEIAVHRDRGAARRRPHAVVAARRPGGRARRHRPLRPRDPGAGRRPAPVDARVTFDPAVIAVPESIEFPTTGGRTRPRALLRADQPGLPRPGRRAAAAHRPDPRRPDVERLDRRSTSTIQLLTSRGIAVVDVDYGGSTGYGREYRRRLDGQWGVVDVDDCVAAARYLVERGDVDPDRLAIEGGSAGGYTTLAALAFRDVVRGRHQPASGSATSRLLGTRHATSSSRATTDRLVGPYPEAADLYRERSPIHFPDRISCPVLVLQGLDDQVVPPAQAEAIVAALAEQRASRTPTSRSRARATASAARTPSGGRSRPGSSFLGQVFGFEPADDSSRSRCRASTPGSRAATTGRRRRHERRRVGAAPSGTDDESGAG